MTATSERLEAVAATLRETAATVAVAESCTGGLLSSMLTDVPGSSQYFDRGVITYSNDAKQSLLAVSREALDEHGAVSEPVSREMARGIRDTAGTRYGVATTGIAGPAGGTKTKPVGTVYIAVAVAEDWGTGASAVTAKRYEFDGDRTSCKRQFSAQALADLQAAIE